MCNHNIIDNTCIFISIYPSDDTGSFDTFFTLHDAVDESRAQNVRDKIRNRFQKYSAILTSGSEVCEGGEKFSRGVTK